MIAQILAPVSTTPVWPFVLYGLFIATVLAFIAVAAGFFDDDSNQKPKP